MRFPRTAHLAGRAFSLGVRATAAACPPVMVPLSFVEAQAAHASQQAARASQTFAVTLALSQAHLKDTQAHLKDTQAQVKDTQAQAAREAQRFDKAMALAQAREAQRVDLLEKVIAHKLATALFERDVARGKVTARALIEEAVAETWRALERLDAEERERVSPSPKGAAVKKPPSTVTDKLQAMLRFPAVAAYLQVAEEDNGLARGVLAKSAAIVYPAVCTPLHGRAAGEQAVRLPAEVFTAIGENGRIAFAALVAFGGRNVGMYQPCGATVSVVLRVPPTLGLSATLAHIRGSARLPAVGASVELGVAGGGAESSGEGVA
jgi:hypothetical protein